METERSPRGILGTRPIREVNMKRTRTPGISRRSTLALMGAGAATFAAPWVARAQATTLKVGMPTILSGRVAQLGTSSRKGRYDRSRKGQRRGRAGRPSDRDGDPRLQ